MKTWIKSGMGMLMVLALVGCQQHGGMGGGSTDPMAGKTLTLGDSAVIKVATKDFGDQPAKVEWSVSPDSAKIEPDAATNGLQATFTTDKAGEYKVVASAKTADGKVISDETTITVNAPAPATAPATEPAAK